MSNPFFFHRVKKLLRENSHPARELGLVFLVASLAGVVVSLTGWAELVLRLLSNTLPLRGGLVVFTLVAMVGIAVFAIRRWNESAVAIHKTKTIIENAPFGIFQLAPDGSFRMANPALIEMLGYVSFAELCRASDSAYPFCMQPEAYAQLLRTVTQDRGAHHFRMQMIRRDGAHVWVAGNLRAVRNAQNVLQYLEGDLRDVTAEQEVETTYHSLVDHSLEGVSIFQNGQYVFANRAAADFYGVTVQELLAMSPEENAARVHPDDRELVVQRLRARLAGKSVPARSVFQILRRDGASRWIEANASLMEYRGAPAILVLTMDVTERKRAQDQMQANLLRASLRQDLNASLARAGMDLDAVLQNIAHLVANTLGDLCVIGLVSADGAWIEPVAFWHIRRELIADLQKMFQGTRLPITHPYLGRVITAGEPLLMAVLEAWRQRLLRRYAYNEYSGKFGITSYLVVPVRHGGRVLGTIHLLRETGGAAYTSEDQILLQDIADRSGFAIANAQLLRQLQAELDARRRAEDALRASIEQLDALHTTSQEIAAQLELSPLLQLIAERAARLVNAPASGLYLCEPDMQLVRLAANYNTKHVLQNIVLHYGEGAAGRVAANGEPLVIPDYANWEGRASVFAPDEFASVITVPMLWQGEVIGALTTSDTAGRVFSDQDMRLLKFFAEQAAMAVITARIRSENVRTTALQNASGTSTELETQEQTQRAFADALREATSLLNRVIDYDKVLDGILETVARITPYESATIFWRAGEELRVVRARGFDKYGLEKWVMNFTLPLQDRKFQQMVKSCSPIVVRDTTTDAEWIMVPEIAWIRSNVSAPIRVGDETVGMICLDSTQVDAYQTEHAERLTAFADLAAGALHSAEILRQAERRAQQLSLLYDAGLTMNRVLDTRTQLEFLFQIARRTLRADRMAYFSYHAEQETLHFELGVDIPDELAESLRTHPFSVKTGEGLVGWVAHHRLPALVEDVRLDARWFVLEDRVRSAVAVPVEHENVLRGVLLANSYTKNAFSPQDERILILFSNQVAAAMELSRLFQAQARRNHELEILREANLLFTTTFDRSKLISQTLDYALRLVTADNAHFFLYENEHLRFGGAKWVRGETLEPPVVPREDGVTYSVARSGQRVVVDDTDTHPLFENWKWGGAIVGMPLRIGDTVHAVLTVAYLQPHHFEPEELRALQLLADQAAVAFENTRHYDETQQQLRDAQLLHRAGEALTRTLSFDEMLEHLADFFMEAVNVDACCISTLDNTREHMVVMLDRDPIPEMFVPAGTPYAISELPYLRMFIDSQQTMMLQRDDPDLTPRIAANMDRFCWKSVLMLPLLAGQEVIGCVELADQKQHRDFPPATVRLAESLAHQAASALQNARLFGQTKRRTQELTLLNRLARRVSGARTPQELGEIVEHETRDLLSFDAFFFALYDEAGNRVRFVRFLDHQELLAPFDWELRPSLTRQVLRSQKTLRFDDLSRNAPKEDPPQGYGGRPVARSWLGAPMRLGDRAVGVISLQAAEPSVYTETDEQLLQTIADQVAVAVERVRDTT